MPKKQPAPGYKFVKVSEQLELHQYRERHIIDTIEKLKSSKECGHFIEALLRVVLEDPKMISMNKEFLSKVASMGVTPVAKEYYDKCNKDIAEMHRKVDAIYDMCFQMYTLALLNKKLALEEKTDNLARANFILQRQVKNLTTTLGALDLKVYESDKDNLRDKAEQALEFIINTYSDVVNEVKVVATPSVVTVESPIKTEKQNIDSIESGETIDMVPNKPKKEDTDTEDLDAFSMFKAGFGYDDEDD